MMGEIKSHVKSILIILSCGIFKKIYQFLAVDDNYVIDGLHVSLVPKARDDLFRPSESERLQFALDHVNGLGREPSEQEINDISKKWAESEEEAQEFVYNIIQFLISVRNGEI